MYLNLLVHHFGIGSFFLLLGYLCRKMLHLFLDYLRTRYVEVVKDKIMWCVHVAIRFQLMLALSTRIGGGVSALSQQFRDLQEHTTTFVSFLGNFWCLFMSESS